MNGADSVHSYGDLKVLIVEDNEVNQKVTHAMLSHFGINPDVAENGLEALEVLKIKKYDLVLMDCQMPVMSGLEATRKIRESSKEPGFKTANDVIIIAMTANANSEDIDACYESGMNDFVAKPVELKIIQNVLEKWYEST